MTWFKVDDKLHSHKKAARAGVAAMGLWTVAGSWCADHLSNGFVPDYIAHRLAPGEADELAERLVTAGLWTPAEHDGDKGWRFNDWGDYQPTREDVESKREYERDKKRRQRRNTEGQFTESPRESLGDTNGTTGGSPAGVTPSRPVPSRTHPDPEDKPPSSTDVDTPTDDGFDHFWTVWPKRNGKKLAKEKAHRAWSRLTLPERREAFRGAKNYAAASDAGLAGAKDAFRWLQGREWPDWQEPAKPAVKKTATRQDPVAARYGEGAR